MKNAYYNGRFSEIDEVRIPLTDRCVYFGDGVYDAMVGRNGKIHMLDKHVERLYRSADAIGLNVGRTPEELCEIIKILTCEYPFPYFIYVQLSRRSETRCHAATDGAEANLLITLTPHLLPSPDKTLSLTFAKDLRYRMCNVKTLNLLPAVLASTRAAEAGYDEAVFVRDGFVTECAHSNISIVKDGVLMTHPDCELILPGITKALLISSAKKLGIPVCERPFTPSELTAADSVLVSSTTKPVLEAEEIDGDPLPHGQSEEARALINAAFSDYWKDMEG